MKIVTKSLPQLAVALVILGVFIAGCYTGRLTAAETLSVVGVLVGIVGVVSVSILNSPLPNTDLFPHLIFTLALIGGMTVLLFHNSITSTELITIVTPIVGGVGGMAGITSTTNAIASLTSGNLTSPQEPSKGSNAPQPAPGSNALPETSAPTDAQVAASTIPTDSPATPIA